MSRVAGMIALAESTGGGSEVAADRDAMRHLRALQGDVRSRADWRAELKREERT